MQTATTAPVTADAAADRVFQAALGAIDTLAIHLGDRLGWYRSLRDAGPATAPELATRTGTDPRYTREWLEQQAVGGWLAVHRADFPADDRRYTLRPGYAEALADPASLAYLAPLARMIAAAAIQLPALERAYRDGGGVGWAAYGADARESQAEMNRPWYEQRLAPALAGLPGIHRRLARPGARIGDIGCGGGWSTIALARAYPEAQLTGHDIDPASVELATANVAAAGLADRVRIVGGDAAKLPARAYDMAFAFECVHDMPRPVAVLKAVCRSLTHEGSLIVMEEAVGMGFTAPGDDVERLMYGFSLLICLPDGMSHQPSAATGTVLRPPRLARYATEAGFGELRVLPIEDFGLWRFYELAH